MTPRSVAKLGLAFATFFIPSVLLAGQALAQPAVEIPGAKSSETEISADGSIIHRASGFVYLARVGDMPLRKVKVFGPGDVSVDYSLRGGGNGDAWVTFYVYPATVALDVEAAAIEQAMLQVLNGRRIDAPGAAPASLDPGRSAWFEGQYQGIDARTGYMLAKRGGWFLKARFTIPKDGGPEAMNRALRALAALQWDWQPAESRPQGAKVAVR